VFLFLLSFSQLIFPQITFNADFDSGNIKSVTTSDSTTFYVTTNSDIGGRWFYFRIAGVKDKFIKVVVTTSPADFSKAMYSYDDKNYMRFSDDESPEYGTFQKTFEQDTVYVAYYTPYPYKMMQENLAKWAQNKYVKLDTIGFTQNLLPIQEMIVTDHAVDDTEKFNVWIHARTHPSETPSSWQFEGIVRELLSNDEVINYYLSKIKFHLIPFSNPDGVFYGRSRTNYNFVDVEREWDKPEVETCLEVRALKARMAEISN
jgi:murein tripeptide amidase MpaA